MPAWIVTVVLWAADKVPALARWAIAKLQSKPKDGYDVIRKANKASEEVDASDEAAANDPNNVDRRSR